MKIAHLELFRAVMREGNFTGVARRRGIDPSAVSRAITTLESDLGIRLFERTTRRFAPTEAGRIYYAQTDSLIEELELAAARARDATAAPAGQLRVTASIAFGCEVLSPLVAGLRERYPALALELVLSDLPLDLVNERLDVAIRLGPAPTGELVRRRLMAVRHRVCASPAWLAANARVTLPAELSHCDCVRFPFPGFSDRWRFRDAEGTLEDVTISGSLVVSNALAAKRCILDGLGPGLLADWMSARELADGTLVELLPAYAVTATVFETAAWILYPSRSYIPTKVRCFIDYLADKLAS